ncbi:radical SAM protein [Deltaproteobacteria bacterium TL4]
MNSPNYSPYPFFMGYAASNLKINGFEVNILDAVAEEEYDYLKFLEEVRAEKADLVILECSTPTLDIDLWFTEKVSKFADVGLAGPHLNPETATDIQQQHPEIKYFLLGEYILSSLEVATQQKEGIYPSEVLKDIDNFPFPFRDYKSATKYYDPSMPTSKPQLQIYSSKGCPFKCTFCSWPQTMYFGNVALRSPEKITQEIKEAVTKHGYKSIFFDDDTFNLGTPRISKLCDYLKDIGLPWTMMGRLDCSPDWLYDKMVDSGCVGMRFGVETFNLDVLKRVKKGIERKDFRAALKYVTDNHPQVMIHLTMMKNMPGMTDDIHENDLKILKEMGFSPDNIQRSYQLSNCAPFPGTELYREMQNTMDVDRLKEYKLYDGGQDTVMGSRQS